VLHPHTTLAWIDDEVGVGVVATRPIPRGTLTWVRDPLDLTLTPDQVHKLGPAYAEQLDRYAYQEADGLVLCWDLGRFLNHHCEANCLAMGGTPFEVAVRDIAVGEQLCDEYGTLGLSGPMPCRCGSPACRGVVQPDDGQRLAPWLWERFLGGLAHVRDVPQPLWELGGAAVERALRQHASVVPADARVGAGEVDATTDSVRVPGGAGPVAAHAAR